MPFGIEELRPHRPRPGRRQLPILQTAFRKPAYPNRPDLQPSQSLPALSSSLYARDRSRELTGHVYSRDWRMFHRVAARCAGDAHGTPAGDTAHLNGSDTCRNRGQKPEPILKRRPHCRSALVGFKTASIKHPPHSG